MKTIEIPIIDDNFWEDILEFRVSLKDPCGCQLTSELHTCRVLISDDDVFPSNKFEAQVQECVNGNDEALSNVGVPLLIAYLQFAFLRVRTVWWKTLICIILDQLHNLFYLASIF